MEYFKKTLWEGKSFYREERSTFVVKVREFSNANAHKPEADSSVFLDCDVNCEGESYSDISEYLDRRGHSIVVYPNGCDMSTEGYVSLEFCFLPDDLLYEVVRSRINHVALTCMITVVDAEGNRRLPQSFAFTHDATQGRISNFFIANFISRGFLLAAADDLLRDDTLTLQVDVVLGEYYAGEYKYLKFSDLVKSSFKTEGGGDGEPKRHYLVMKSVVAERLRRESKYFERLSVTPLVEGSSDRVKIPDGEYYNFLNMVTILWKLALYDGAMEFTFGQILNIYATADYYGTDRVLDTCRRWLKLACRTSEDASTISSLADFYGDTLLKEFAVGAINEKSTEGDYLEESDEEWICIPRCTASKVYFLFQPRLKIGLKEGRSEAVDEDVGEISNCYL